VRTPPAPHPLHTGHLSERRYRREATKSQGWCTISPPNLYISPSFAICRLHHESTGSIFGSGSTFESTGSIFSSICACRGYTRAHHPSDTYYAAQAPRSVHASTNAAIRPGVHHSPQICKDALLCGCDRPWLAAELGGSPNGRLPSSTACSRCYSPTLVAGDLQTARAPDNEEQGHVQSSKIAPSQW
jgi:hypothetical protein